MSFLSIVHAASLKIEKVHRTQPCLPTVRIQTIYLLPDRTDLSPKSILTMTISIKHPRAHTYAPYYLNNTYRAVSSELLLSPIKYFFNSTAQFNCYLILV